MYHTPVVNLVKKTCYTVYICYDDGCHLKIYATHPERCNQTETAEKIAGLNIVVDKLHSKGMWMHGAKKTVTHTLVKTLIM